MKMAQGYITEDGTFFESKLEAELFEAELKLRGRFIGMNLRINVDEFLAMVIELMPQVKGYIDAYEAADTAARNQQAEESERKQDEVSQAAETVESRAVVSSAEEDLTSLLKLPTRRLSHVPNMGSSTSTEAVPERRKVDGAGGG